VATVQCPASIGIQPLAPTQLSELATFGVGFERSHAALVLHPQAGRTELAGGQLLAGVGARIVAEVFLGLLGFDRHSYLALNPRWRPTRPSRTRGTFTMVDLLTFAKVDPASRGQSMKKAEARAAALRAFVGRALFSGPAGLTHPLSIGLPVRPEGSASAYRRDRRSRGRCTRQGSGGCRGCVLAAARASLR
jgi:hypothetical protein